MDRTALRAELQRDEGLRLESYKDSVGLWTVGIGHLLGEERRMLRITLQEAYALLDWDIHEAESIVRKLCPQVPINDHEPQRDVRHRALVNMAFNLGEKRLSGFKAMLAAVNEEDWPKAAAAALDSLWSKQVGKRAIRIASMLETGEVA